MCAVSVKPLLLRSESAAAGAGGGEVSEERGEGGGGGEKGGRAGGRPKLDFPSLNGEGLEDGWGGRAKEPRCVGVGENDLGSGGNCKAERSAGRGGGVGGAGVVVRECEGVEGAVSIVRDNHSLVTARRSGLLNGGWREMRSWVVESGG